MANDAKPPLVESIRREIGSLILQLNLGKADAIDFVEKHKGDLHSLVDQAQEKIESGSARQKLDELKLQLALGKMESREALEEQRGKIEDAFNSARQEWEPVQADLKSSLEEQGQSLKTKLDALALDLGIGKIVAEEELQLKKNQFKSELESVQAQLKPALDEAADEAKKALESVRANLRSLFD